MAHEIPQPAPAVGLRAIDGVTHTGGPEPQQCLGGFAVVPRDERDGGDSGELAHEPRDGGERLTLAAMDGDDDGIHPPAAGDVQGFAQ